MLKTKICLLSLVTCIVFAGIANVVDQYQLDMLLKIPRVYDNNNSLGYRKLQAQRLRGVLNIEYIDGEMLPRISIEQLVNKTHKLANGASVKYECFKEDDQIDRLMYIGSNKKNIFKTPGMTISFVAQPSYALSYAQEDNSLYIQLSGYGKTSKTLSYHSQVPSRMLGYVTGNIGCGCSDYGHTSPTRLIGPYSFIDIPIDVAPIYGKWKMKFIRRTIK